MFNTCFKPRPLVITQAVAKYLHRFFANARAIRKDFTHTCKNDKNEIFRAYALKMTRGNKHAKKGGRILAIRLDFSLRSKRSFFRKRSFFERMTSKGSYTTQADFKICGGAVVVLSDFWGRARHKVCGCLKFC
ncbi:hypothetical protein T36_0419 [Helicobacter cinaedi]|uniref:hypothetical protein n=1 Tax=Helicobacter cinaedi TaxID=213 RepID=UPI001F3E3C94|nr:hypothetical protein [Helicobacter cinaedi]BDB63972.1 hypothetical protein T36_0419 [Helicobacter cinaedi]